MKAHRFYSLGNNLLLPQRLLAGSDELRTAEMPARKSRNTMHSSEREMYEASGAFASSVKRINPVERTLFLQQRCGRSRRTHGLLDSESTSLALSVRCEICNTQGCWSKIDSMSDCRSVDEVFYHPSACTLKTLYIAAHRCEVW